MYVEVKCPDDDQKVKPKRGRAECVVTSSGTVCYTVCTEKGFTPETYTFAVCNDNGQWSRKLPGCIGKGSECLLRIFKLGNVPIKSFFLFTAQPYIFIKSTYLHKEIEMKYLLHIIYALIFHSYFVV